MSSRIAAGSVMVMALMLVSCGDDPALVAKNNKLVAEIESYEIEVAELRQKLKAQPKDVSKELQESKRMLKQMESEAEKLESELVGLRDEKSSLEKKFSDYREKYPIN